MEGKTRSQPCTERTGRHPKSKSDSDQRKENQDSPPPCQSFPPRSHQPLRPPTNQHARGIVGRTIKSATGSAQAPRLRCGHLGGAEHPPPPHPHRWFHLAGAAAASLSATGSRSLVTFRAVPLEGGEGRRASGAYHWATELPVKGEARLFCKAPRWAGPGV